MKNILVPVDFSDYSKYAMEVAASIAKKHQASIHVVHMMGLTDAVLTRDESQEVFEAMYHMKLTEKRFDELLNVPYLEGVTVHQNVKNYTNFTEINDVAISCDADLIVMGSHGSTGLKEVFVGSNTEKVVRTATTPVLVIKDHMPDFNLEKVVFACDFKGENVDAFKQIRKLIKVLGAQMELLYVNLPGERFRSSIEIEDRIYKFFAQAGIEDLRPKDVNYYIDYTVEDGIFNYSFSNKADAIAIPTHGRSGLAHFFAGNFLNKTLQLKIRKAIPVMVALIACLFILRGLGLGIPYVSPKLNPQKIEAKMECH
ncbi:universal stress protein [Gilvibacter sp.]|uniref:universal stress protein n=1 Tax=Gilvibacter sp. TaxID=2729997 RepID=UPI0025BD3F1A|nr:universal stress protein [Gilvibacter sp.]NQX77589.1 universal stress protein [Gilvibacter sp.]